MQFYFVQGNRLAFAVTEMTTLIFYVDPEQKKENFDALVSLLAENIASLKQHLTCGKKNARYTSKAVQNWDDRSDRQFDP